MHVFFNYEILFTGPQICCLCLWVSVHERGDFLGQRAAVKARGTGFGYGLQRVGMAGRAPDLASLRCPLGSKGVEPVPEVRFGQGGAKQLGSLLPAIGDRR